MRKAIGYPFPATVLVVDMRSFSKLTNPEQVVARQRLYGLLADAFESGDVEWDLCTHEDRGDGVLVIAPVEVSKVVLLDSVLAGLAARVEAAPRLNSGWSMRLRVAVHAGEVHHDDNGFVGADVNHVFRLVDSDVLREALSDTERRCAVLVSDALYQGVIRHGYGDLDPNAFHRTVVRAKEMTATAWLSVPGDEGTARGVAGRNRVSRPMGGQVSAGGDVTMTDSSIVGGNQHIGDHVQGDKVGRDKFDVQNATFVNQVRNYSAKHPVAFSLIILLLVAALAVGGYAAVSAAGGESPVTEAAPSSTPTMDVQAGAPPQTTNPALAQGLSDPQLIVGSWTSSDNAGTKSFRGNNEQCDGFFYHNGQPLDIGGPMTCLISSQSDANGRYTLQVTQGPNRASYKISFDSADQASVYEPGGTVLYRLARF